MSLAAEIDSMSRPRSLSMSEPKSAISMPAGVGSGRTRMPMAIQFVSNTWANVHISTHAGHPIPHRPIQSRQLRTSVEGVSSGCQPGGIPCVGLGSH